MVWLPWGYIMGPEPDFTRRIPGLKIETWGTRPISSEFSRRYGPPKAALLILTVNFGLSRFAAGLQHLLRVAQ